MSYIVVEDVQLAKNFRLSEFVCKDGSGRVLWDPELVEKLQKLRDRVGGPIRINSAYRTPEHNRAVNGSPTSQHLLGKAADLQLPAGLTVDRFAEIAEYVGFRGIGLYPWGIHVDVRDTQARWDYR